MPAIPENISIKGVIVGALAGTVLGALISLVLMTMRPSDGQERVTPGVSNYLRLGFAMIMLVRQASQLIAPPLKED